MAVNCSPYSVSSVYARLRWVLAFLLLLAAIVGVSVVIKEETNDRESISALKERIRALEAKLASLQRDAVFVGQAIHQNAHQAKEFPPVRFLSERNRLRILITGGAGFVGSHLVDALMKQGHEVVVVDNFFTGRKHNIEHWIGHKNFELINHDVVEPILIEVDQIYHLACPASPPHYMYNPIKTIKTSAIGTLNMLGLAKRVHARLLLASTSEVYGDPQVHPQPESYWGNVNPIGPRACYDEGKRVAETMCYAYQKQDNVQVRVARIFNTFGPRMHMSDGRVVSNFVLQALQGEPLTIYGSGSQTRSFQYVSDLVDGLIKLMNSGSSQPVNLGNPDEYSILEFAKVIREEVGKATGRKMPNIVHKKKMEDDPQKRKPDITVAKKLLGWEPQVPVREGIKSTIEYFQDQLKEEAKKP
ncbi:UDP-glucuronic acid decarboxylase 1-like isoform X2 [Oscarella lobularis]|uniref:UDP-glucuronic acid decarboxylase 1-like isoform X2 n=1 Tax=Oscarella lobularis TaxID=121494 RepID=UPI0033136D62